MAETEIHVTQIVPGTANQLIGANAAATKNEYKTLSGTASQITVTNSVGAITLSLPSSITTPGSLTVTSGLSVGGNIFPTSSNTQSVGSNSYPFLNVYTSGLDLYTSSTTNIRLTASGSASYALALPATQGAANTTLINDGSGNLSFSQLSLTSSVTGVLPVANGGTNSSTALTNNKIMSSLGGSIVESTGVIQSSVTISSNTTWTGDRYIPSGSVITINTGVVLTINGTIEAGLYKIFNCIGTGAVIFQINVTTSQSGPYTNTTVYPEWWGATGDGSTDDTAAINAAIASFQVGFARVLFCGFQYFVSGTIQINGVSYIKLEGTLTPWRASPLPQITSTSTTADVLKISAISDGVTVESLAFTRSSGGTSGSKTINVGAVLTPTFTNCAWSGSQYGLYASGTSGLTVNNCNGALNTVNTTTQYGIYVDGTSSDCTGVAVNNFGFLSSTTTDTVYVYADIQTGGTAKGCGDRRLFGIHGSGQTNYGVYLQDGGGFSADVIISDVSFDTVTNTGVTIISASANFAQNANIYSGWINLTAANAVGVLLKNRDFSNVSGILVASGISSALGVSLNGSNYSTINYCNFDGSFSSGVLLTSNGTNYSVNNSVSSCTVLGTAPLTISANCNNNSIIGNFFSSISNAGSLNTIIIPDSTTGYQRIDANGNVGLLMSINGTNAVQIARDTNDTYFDYTGAIGRLLLRSGVNGTITASLDSLGNFGATVITSVATTNQLVLGVTHTTTISAPAPSASRTYTIPDAGGAANFLLSGWGQIVNADIANSTINLTTKVTGILPIANGGTNSSAVLVNNNLMGSSGGKIVESVPFVRNDALQAISIGYGAPTTTGTAPTNESITTFGYNAGAALTSPQDVVAIGAYALASCTTGIDNTAVGDHALSGVSTGQGNTAVGSSCLPACLGSFNTAIGVSALQALTSGGSNTALGSSAMDLETTGSNNTAVGDQALKNQNGASGNIGVGESAGFYITTGGFNILMGYQAGAGLTSGAQLNTGTYNIVLGYRADVSSTSATNAIAIGQGATAASNQTVIGNSSITSSIIYGNTTLNGLVTSNTSSPSAFINSISGTAKSQLAQDNNDTYIDFSGAIGRLLFRNAYGGGTTVMTLANSGTLSLTNNLSFNSASHGIVGITSGSSAASGNVGQVVTSTAGFTNAPTSATYGDLTSISLTAGNWLISVAVSERGSTATYCAVGVSTTSGNSSTGLTDGQNQFNFLPSSTATDSTCSFANYYVQPTSTTTYYLKYQAAYASGTPAFAGTITAVRVS